MLTDLDTLRLRFEASERESEHGFNLHKYGIGYADEATQARWEAWIACRAAMLQGAEPVTTAYKLRYAVETIRNSGIEINAEKIFAERDALNSPVIPDGWVACSERMPETMVSVLVTGTWFHHSVAFWDGLSWCDLDFEQPVTHWMPLPAAPQQEA